MVRLAHTLAEQKLPPQNAGENDVRVPPFCDAVWANPSAEENLMDGHSAPCKSHLVPQQEVSQSRAKLLQCRDERSSSKGQDETEYVRLFWYELEHGSLNLRKQDKHISATPGAPSHRRQGRGVRCCVKIRKCWSDHDPQTISN